MDLTCNRIKTCTNTSIQLLQRMCGNDLYFNVSLNGQTYTFTVESYLCDNTTDVYNAVKNLKIGDTIDMEGFLYWYEGVNPHITSVTVK